MIKLKSHAIPASPFNGERVIYYRGKPETIVTAEVEGIREALPQETVHLRLARSPMQDPRTCVMCGAITGPNAPWMDSKDKWQGHPFRCR